MGKIETLSQHIAECESFSGSNKAAKELVNQLKGIYYNDIPNIDMSLDVDYESEANYLGAYTEMVDRTDYKSHIAIIHGKLVNLKNDLILEEKRADRELELARLKQPQMTQTTNVSVNVTIDQTIELVNQIPSTVLCDADKQNLIGDLCDMDKQKKLGNKDKVWDVAKKVLGFIADKGADAAIAAMPLIIKALQG